MSGSNLRHRANANDTSSSSEVDRRGGGSGDDGGGGASSGSGGGGGRRGSGRGGGISSIAQITKAASAVIAPNMFSTPTAPRKERANSSLSDLDADTLNVFAVWAVMAAVYVTMFYDFVWGGFGTSNSKGLSFIASLLNSFDFRCQKPMTPRKKPRTKAFARREKRGSLFYYIADSENNWVHRIWLFAAATLVKYGASTVVSLCMCVRPVILKGPRHFIQFGVAFFFVQLCPGDWAYNALKTPAIRVVVRLAACLYKHRKFLFVVETYAPHTSVFSWLMMVFTGVIVVDGTSLLRRTENAVMNRGVSYRTAGKFGRECMRAYKFTWNRCRSSICWTLGMGICTAVREHVISNIRTYRQLWMAELVNIFYFFAKVAVLIFFVDRSLKTIWKDTVGTFEALDILRRPMSTNGDHTLSSPALRPSSDSWTDIPALALEKSCQAPHASPSRRQRQVRSKRAGSGENGYGTRVVSGAATAGVPGGGGGGGGIATPHRVACDRPNGSNGLNQRTAAVVEATPYTKARRVLGLGRFGISGGGDRGAFDDGDRNGNGDGSGSGSGAMGMGSEVNQRRKRTLKKFSSSDDVPYPLYDTNRGSAHTDATAAKRVSLSAVWSIKQSKWVISDGVAPTTEARSSSTSANAGASSHERRRNSAPSSLGALFGEINQHRSTPAKQNGAAVGRTAAGASNGTGDVELEGT